MPGRNGTRDGKKTTCLTPGDFDVTRLLGVDDSGELVYFLASPGNPVERYLYRVGLDGSNLARVTPAEEERGTHGDNISPDGSVAIVSSSIFDDPPVTRLVTLPGHKELLVLENNEKLRKKVEALDRSPVVSRPETRWVVGIERWGAMSLNAIFMYSKLYSAAIAIASVPNQRHYETMTRFLHQHLAPTP